MSQASSAVPGISQGTRNNVTKDIFSMDLQDKKSLN